MSHTPTPWTWAGYAGGNEPANFSILTKDTYQQPGSEREERMHLADVYSTPHDAAHIVRCVNAHDQLVAALQDAYDDLNFDGTYTVKELLKTIEEVRSNITKALAATEKGA